MDKLFNDLTPAQEKIIKDICYFQLSSLRRLYNDQSLSDLDMELYLAQNEVPKEEFKSYLEVRIEETKRLSVRPEEIDKMSSEDLSTFKTILCNIEDKYYETFPKAVSRLWERLFILTDFKEVERIIAN